MNFGLNFGLLGGSVGGKGRLCITQGSNGAWYGFSTSPSFGAANPPIAADGTSIHAVMWKDDGTFVMSFGTDGRQQLTGIDTITYKYKGSVIVFSWDAATTAYIADNLPAATFLISNYVQGEDICGTVTGLPDLLIHYDFDIMYTGAKI